VIQVINVLDKKKLVTTRKDKSDHRKRLISLSKKGIKLAEDLGSLWEIVSQVSDEILNESDPELLDRIAKVEIALKQKSTYQRIHEKLYNVDENFKFIPYHEKYSKDFQQLNEDWLSSYLEVSEYDKNILADPENKIISNNGEIFLLINKENVIGTYALQKINQQDCELSKFTVKKEFRGRKLGEMMLEHAILRAKTLGCRSIVLFTHHKLKEATRLYKKMGFTAVKEHPGITDETGRCSLLLQLIINQ
jgi:ribosomal protein S18 acetylase RimI-like enzyme